MSVVAPIAQGSAANGLSNLLQAANNESSPEVFVDAFGQESTQSDLSSKLAEAGGRSSKFGEQMHAIMNVAAVLALVSFVALQRNASIDLAQTFMSPDESRFLSKPFETLCS